MKILFVLIFSIAIIGCGKKSHKVQKTYFLQSPVPTSVLNLYLKKSKIASIEDGVSQFEIRRWHPFYYVDSFPVALERIFLEKGQVKAECYLYSDDNGGLITTWSELENMKFQKYSIDSLPISIFDSLSKKYNLSEIDSSDFSQIKKINANPQVIKTYHRILFEKATSQEYRQIFISDPENYDGVSEKIDKLASFSKFISRELLKQDPKFKIWFEEKGREIINNQ